MPDFSKLLLAKMSRLEAALRTSKKLPLFLFFGLAVFVNYLPDLVPTYIEALSRGHVKNLGSLNQFRESCHELPRDEWSCRARYRIPVSELRGSESLGIGVMLFPVSFQCADSPAEIVYSDSLSDFNATKIASYLRTYQTFDLLRLNCRSDLIIENWAIESFSRHGLSQSSVVVGESDWVAHVKNLVELSISGLLSIIAAVFITLNLITWLLGKITQSQVRFPPFDKFKYYWLAFIILNSRHLFETIFPIYIPYGVVPKFSNFLGLMIICGPAIASISVSGKVNAWTRKIAESFIRKRSQHPYGLIIFCLLIVVHPYFRFTFTPAIIIFSGISILISIIDRNLTLAFFGIAGICDALKILMIPNLPASRVTVLYLFFVFVYQMIPLILRLQRNAYFEAGTDVLLEVAHDIRSPVTALRTVLPGLGGPEELKSIADEALSKIRNICKVVLERTQSESFSEDRATSFSLELLIRRIVAVKKLEYVNSKILFASACEELWLGCKASELAVERAISNLVNNACESVSGSAAEVNISLTAEESFAVISIQDNGSGIRQEILERLGSSPIKTDKVGGNGFGLFYVKKTLRKIHGQIHIESSLGNGTEVILKLPSFRKSSL